MEKQSSFSYTYSASENREILNIRKKYLPQEETKLEELKRLDRLVESSGVMEALVAGIGGAMVFGLGLCLAMEATGHFAWLGFPLGLVGAVGMLVAFPVHRKFFNKTKAQYSPRILELAAELSNQI